MHLQSTPIPITHPLPSCYDNRHYDQSETQLAFIPAYWMNKPTVQTKDCLSASSRLPRTPKGGGPGCVQGSADVASCTAEPRMRRAPCTPSYSLSRQYRHSHRKPQERERDGSSAATKTEKVVAVTALHSRLVLTHDCLSLQQPWWEGSLLYRQQPSSIP